MSIESPISYGDWYWKHSVDALRLRAEQAEKSYAPVIQQILNDSGLSEFMPNVLRPLFGNLTAPTEPDWDEIQRPFLGLISKAVGVIAGDEIARPFKYEAAEKNLTMRIDAETATTLQQRKKITEDLYMGRMHSEGYADSEISHFYNSRLPYPPFEDIITWARYHGDPYNPKELAWSKFQISPDDWELWEWLSVQKLTTGQIQSLYVRDTWDIPRTDDELARLGWRRDDLLALHNLAYEVPNAMLMVQGSLMQGKSEDEIATNISKAGIHPEYAIDYVNAVLTKPATEDIIAYELRRDPSLSNLDTELRQIGIHPNYNSLYKELAYQIPPVADIITMAVREAFTPDIAARFGQYQDLPSEYVEAVQKKGLSKEWAERYWAAHWSLPSPQQGFEMLHRGIIGTDDLYMLMRALDIMPYWRDKLIEMAYRPLSRVDVRRMYGLGTLDEAGIMKAYRDLGYNDYNANKMTDFTVRYTRQTQSRFTSGDVVSAFTKYLIGSGEARSILSDIGIRDAEISNIIEKASYKRSWSSKQETIDAIKNLYKKGKYSDVKAVDELRKLNLPQDYINTQLQQWQAKAAADTIATWTTAQTLSFLKAGLITEERARKEFVDLGYDAEHINVYIASTIPAP